MRIVVGAPIRDRAWAMPSWLEHLRAAAVEAEKSERLKVSFVFIENDSVDGTLDLLRAFCREWCDEHPDEPEKLVARLIKHDIGYAHYKVPFSEGTKGLAEGERYNPKNDKHELGVLRNLIVSVFLEMEGDLLVMWDSDVWMPRQAISADQRSLVQVMLWRRTLGTMCADTQHPNCDGKFHNAMVEVRGGLYNHPDAKLVHQQSLLSFWIPEGDGRVRYPMGSRCLTRDQRASRYYPGSDEILYLAAMGTTGGGGAAIVRREMFLPPVAARYGAAAQGEDVPLCERIRKCGHEVALYSGIRGLHLTRELLEKAGGVDGLDPYGEWVEDWRKLVGI